MFIHEDAQNWKKSKISQRKTEILKMDLFADLGRKYQLDKFCLEYQMRQNIGGKFSDVTSFFLRTNSSIKTF
jgi:hypothetical protein